MKNKVTINVLTSPFSTPNSSAFIFPLKMNKLQLEESNIHINYFSKINSQITNADIIFIDSKFFRNKWDEKNINRTLSEFEYLKKNKSKLVYSDISDSSGVMHFKMLDHVDYYMKNQIFKNKNYYMDKLYGMRLYSHYFYENFNVKDQDPIWSVPLISKVNLKKILLGWNSCFNNYGLFGNYQQFLQKRIQLDFLLFNPLRYRSDFDTRKKEVQIRFGSSNYRNSVGFFRKMVGKKLKRYSANSDKINRISYFNELKNTKLILSPFGFGEINYKDFEVFITGGALMKPSMDHMITWPNLYTKETVVFHDWDFKDIDMKIEYFLDNSKSLKVIAENGQENYFTFLNNKRLFVDYFLKIVQKVI